MGRRFGLIWSYVLLGVALSLVLLVVIANLLPSFGGGGPSKLWYCSINLKKQGAAFWAYAQDYNGEWPAAKAHLGSLCEQTLETRNALVGAMATPPGASIPKVFYCPVNTAQDPAILWNVGGVSMWGYVWMNDRGQAGAALPAKFPARSSPLRYFSTPNVQQAAAILALDVIVSDTNVTPLNLTPKGVAVSFGTNHVPVPQTPPVNYVNVLYADGHVDTVNFDPKNAVAVKQPGGGYFWFPNP